MVIVRWFQRGRMQGGSGQRIAGISVNGRREQGGLLGTILTLQGRLERRLVADGRQQSLFRQGSCGVNDIAVHWQPPDEIAKQVNRPCDLLPDGCYATTSRFI